MSVFNFDGEEYKKASRHQKEWGNKIIAGLELKGNESVLDLGSGDGTLTAELADRVPEGRVLGIDAAEGMIESATKLERKNLAFQLMDINELCFEDEFDLVFSNATLQWIKDHRALLKKVYRSLKSGGAVRFNFAGDGNCSSLIEVVGEVMRAGRFRDYFEDFYWPWYMPAIDEYAALAGAIGFKDLKVWGENADRYFSDVEEMTRWIDHPSIVPFLKYIEGEDKDLFRNEVVEKMVKATLQEDGTCFETFRRVNLWGRK
ncbi:MAG: methyltransferase domain-containing protein [Planctomycetota bacterium]|jgi:trans-aconitate methyltransferase